MSELEIKFVCQNPAQPVFEQTLKPLLIQQGVQCSSGEKKQLENDYFDTPEQLFEQHKIGMRTRGCDGKYEQTVKTNGVVQGGLHERAEFNIPLDKPVPDLTKFDPTIWPDDFDIKSISQSLTRQFSTHFERIAYQISYNDAQIEMVFDSGEVITDKAKSLLNEIELELVSGNAIRLFDLASAIIAHLPIRLSDVSKAQQGYQLLHGVVLNVVPLPAYLPLKEYENTESSFSQAINKALEHWQYHEHLFLETGSEKMLLEVYRAIQLLIQSVSLFLPVLQCFDLLKLHKDLIDYAKQWMWIKDLQSIRYLLSKKSLYNKRLAKDASLLSYFQGRKAGLLQAHDPYKLFFSSNTTELKLSVGKILMTKPWRSSVKSYDTAIIEHAKGWMSQTWQTVQTTMPQKQLTHASGYLAVEMLLRQAVMNGFILGSVFDEAKEHYIAPWLDILTGIDELRAIALFKDSLIEAETSEQKDLQEWIEQKNASLLKVMERSREVAVKADVYW